MPNRKYCPAYITYGLIAIGNGGESLLHCVIYMKTLFDLLMKPSLLKRYLVTNHVEEKEQDESYFHRLGENAKRQRLDKTGVIYQKKKGVAKASYEVALLVAKNMKAHTIGESLVMPAAKILVKNVIGVETAAKLKTVCLSNNTVKNRIEEMSIDIADQVKFVKTQSLGFLCH